MKIIGAGITGATIARILTDRGIKVTVYERGEIGGMCADYRKDGILVHKNGAHIWHNSDGEVQEFVERFTKFNEYVHIVKASYHGRLYDFPVNLNTFRQVCGITTEAEARKCHPNIMQEMFFKEYSLKQWGAMPPQEILNRVPIRYNDDNRYFTDRWQGIPVDGYKVMIENMLDGIEVIHENCHNADIVTGTIDEYYAYKLGVLPYRSMNFLHETRAAEYFQDVAIVNYTDETPYTRIIEHKHFEKVKTDNTIITYEFPRQWEPGMDRHYPMFDFDLYKKYTNLGGPIFAGRLGSYEYLNMNIAVKKAIELCKQI